MKTVILIGLLTALLLVDVGPVAAGITERIIYAGDTPLASDCQLTRTGPMELTVVPCTFTTTGQAKIMSRLDSAFALTGLGSVAQALREDKAEWHGNRVRAWLRDKNGEIIERSITYRLTTSNSMLVPVGGPYFIYLVKKSSLKMEVILLSTRAPRPANYIHILAFEFPVPLGTTNLSGIDMEVFTVKPDFPPAKSLFEK